MAIKSHSIAKYSINIYNLLVFFITLFLKTERFSASRNSPTPSLASGWVLAKAIQNR